VETHARALDASTPHWALHRRGGDGEGYRLRVSAQGARLDAEGVAGLRHGVETLLQLVDARGALPACEIEDAPDFAARGLLLDVSRGRVPTEAFLRETVDLCARLKLNVLLLYLEHPFAFRRHPAIGAGSSPLEAGTLRALDRYAAERGVELVPCLQSLGHMERVLSLRPYAHLAETDAGWTLAPVDPGTPACWATSTRSSSPTSAPRASTPTATSPGTWGAAAAPRARPSWGRAASTPGTCGACATWLPATASALWCGPTCSTPTPSASTSCRTT
jgi:hypothetical protein